MKIFIISLLIAVGIYQSLNIVSKGPVAQKVLPGVYTTGNNDALHQAYIKQQHNVQVKGEGVVIKILPDDTKGSKHQRFIVKLASGQTLLIAHNIDLAPRINHIETGEYIQFYGEYEWNNKGGVVHWTHHDPQGRHIGGWLKYQGKLYQ